MVRRIPHRQLQNLAFSVYTAQEVKKLSVVEVRNPNAFDTLDHPVHGGLYDPYMGPSDQHEMCLTCGLEAMHCPGHVGHIVLPLPVYNPVFIKTLYQVLQGCCFSCHRLMAPAIAVTLALYQFEALNYGLVGTVQELSEALSDPSFVTHDASNVNCAITDKLKNIISNAISGLDTECLALTSQTKGVLECGQRIRKDFIKENLVKSRSTCPHCGVKKAKVYLRYNSHFVCSSSRTQIIVKNQDEEISVGNESMPEQMLHPADSDKSNIDLMPNEVKQHLNLLWEKENSLLKHLFCILNVKNDEMKCPVDVFFTELLIVPPTRFRPISVVKGRKYLNAQSAALKDVLTDTVLLRNLLRFMKGENISSVEQDQVSKIPGKTNLHKMNHIWHQLQIHVNCVYDSDLEKLSKDKVACGVKQILEKKEGLFRKHMMGKRVNFAARSVISPDPYIMVDEIGVPMVFAKKLTFPTPVTDWNVEALRKAILRGPNGYPGADKVENADGKVIKLKADDPEQRNAIACKLLTPSSNYDIHHYFPKKVHRHLQNGDILLLNRQPTLHKPSIMAHRARVLPGEKTLRLHYANCKSYNADFDGDEMNAHFPQSELARAEGYHIVSVNHQYLVPKDGTPLSGLIQDHIIAGILLTMRGTFFTKEEYHQLVYGAIEFVPKSIRTLPPCLIKPEALWSGKQVFSTVIINLIPNGFPPPTIEVKAKTSIKNWLNSEPRKWCAGGTPLKNDSMSETEVIIHSGQLLCGVIDKANIGPTPYGLIHCCYELYGGETSTALLTALAKLFTHFLQVHAGFTLGVEDILLTKKACRKRKKVLFRDSKVGDDVIAKVFNVEDSLNKQKILQKFRQAHLSRDDEGLKMLDFEAKKVTDSINNAINGICMPKGLLKRFPKNNLQLMVQSGAKGSTVNAMQISCLLGQIELEGRRVPLMLNGSSLPSFRPYDTSPRAGGFVDGRFLTGIQPQEFFFHCMAGREGLVDTAVKTSRSGYLQRCLIKHLEGLVIGYDLTVRDSDGSVIQLLYGEDGLDIAKMQMLKRGKMHLLVQNHRAVINEDNLHDFVNHQKSILGLQKSNEVLKLKSLISKWKKCRTKIDYTRHSPFLKFAVTKTEPSRRGNLVGEWHLLNAGEKKKYSEEVEKCPDPISSKFRPDLVFGVISENLDDIIEDYISINHKSFCKKNPKTRQMSPEEIKKLAYYKAVYALAHPGEAVGLLAAQSVGEPSTQMTLNTFHFAGRGEMNVTLGIPRLREILMVASANISTPSMDLPLLDVPDIERKAEKLKLKLSCVPFEKVLKSVEIKEVLVIKSSLNHLRKYSVRINILPYNAYKDVYYTSPSNIITYIEDIFIRDVIAAMTKKLTSLKDSKLVSYASHVQKKAYEGIYPSHEESQPLSHNSIDVEEQGSSDEGEGDGDTIFIKTKSRHNQDFEYEEAEPGENEQEAEGNEEETDMNDESDNCEHSVASIASKKLKQAEEEALKQAKVQNICNKYKWISDYTYSLDANPWCQFTLKLCLERSKLDLHTLVEDVISKAILYSKPNIRKAFLVKNPDPTSLATRMLKTDGVNFLEIFQNADILDMKRIYSNDIHAVVNIFGIEAAAKVIVKEIKSVFATYGIDVDPRHLLLIADYMTFDGTYKPCNRIGMASNASPLQQMSFETTMSFLQSAALVGSVEQLKSPSSRLVVGRLVSGGTGVFDLWAKPCHSVA